MAEAERYTPQFLQRFNRLRELHGLAVSPVTLRITGCPNGCARPSVAEVALTGRAPGRYNLYLGGAYQDRKSTRLNSSHVATSYAVLCLRKEAGVAARAGGRRRQRLHRLPRHGGPRV